MAEKIDPRIPPYYIGKRYGYLAGRVISDFDLSYNVGTAVTYLLRAGKKPRNTAEKDIRKALHHLEMELEHLGS